MDLWLAISLLSALTLFAFLLNYLDRRKVRSLCGYPPLSVIIPCHNDAETVAETIQSVYASYSGPLDVLVINDKSTDQSLAVLKSLQKKYRFRLVSNRKNLGKSLTLNKAFREAKYDHLLFLDADTLANPAALDDALRRLEYDPRLGAVSCPYKPKNKGLLPLMQNIEYNMTAFVKGSYNMFSAITLWGGFIVTRKSAFRDCGGFSLNAITEDIDLAYKMNENGWRVEQSSVFVLTYVPDTLSAWFRQKLRWTSGAFQANMTHFGTWIRNPIHMIFFGSYASLTLVYVTGIVTSVFWFDNFFHLVQGMGVEKTFYFLWLFHDEFIMRNVFTKLLFSLYALPYSLPLISSVSDGVKLLLIIPFSLTYFPIYVLISFLGFFIGFYKFHTLEAHRRAW